MLFQTELVPARLVKRYKRFLADCILDDGREVTAHCANPGSMMGLKDEGTKIWLEPNDDPKKKLKYGWRLVDHENGHFTGVDTSLPNRVLRAGLEAQAIEALAAYTTVASTLINLDETIMKGLPRVGGYIYNSHATGPCNRICHGGVHFFRVHLPT